MYSVCVCARTQFNLFITQFHLFIWPVCSMARKYCSIFPILMIFSSDLKFDGHTETEKNPPAEVRSLEIQTNYKTVRRSILTHTLWRIFCFCFVFSSCYSLVCFCCYRYNFKSPNIINFRCVKITWANNYISTLNAKCSKIKLLFIMGQMRCALCFPIKSWQWWKFTQLQLFIYISTHLSSGFVCLCVYVYVFHSSSSFFQRRLFVECKLQSVSCSISETLLSMLC